MRSLIPCATLALSMSIAAQIPAQAPPPQPSGPAAEVQGSYTRLKANILKAADKMPADAYTFKPTPDIRSYARVVDHIIEAQLHTCHALSGTPFDASKVPAEAADKAAIVDALRASFDLCDKAYAGLSDATMAETLSMGPMKRTRTGLAWGNISHDNEQYATLSLYLRLKGLVPPTSEK